MDMFEEKQSEIRGSQKSTWKNLWHVLFSEIQDWSLRGVQTAFLPEEINILKEEKRVQILRAGSICGIIESLAILVSIAVLTGVLMGRLSPFGAARPTAAHWAAMLLALFWITAYTAYMAVRCFLEARNSQYAVYLYSVFMNWRLIFGGIFAFVFSFLFAWLIPHKLSAWLNYYAYQFPNAVSFITNSASVLGASAPYLLGYIALSMGLPALVGHIHARKMEE